MSTENSNAPQPPSTPEPAPAPPPLPAAALVRNAPARAPETTVDPDPARDPAPEPARTSRRAPARVAAAAVGVVLIAIPVVVVALPDGPRHPAAASVVDPVADVWGAIEPGSPGYIPGVTGPVGDGSDTGGDAPGASPSAGAPRVVPDAAAAPAPALGASVPFSGGGFDPIDVTGDVTSGGSGSSGGSDVTEGSGGSGRSGSSGGSASAGSAPVTGPVSAPQAAGPGLPSAPAVARPAVATRVPSAPAAPVPVTTPAAPKPAPAPAPAAPKPTPVAPKPVAAAPSPATYSAVAGPGCGTSAGRSYQEKGRYSDGVKGWRDRSIGYRGDGCDGTAVAVPMSGAAKKDDPKAYTLWKYRTGSVSTGTCRPYVYIPAGTDIREAGGKPATYVVYDALSGGSAIGGFTIDQTASRGRWVTGPAFPVAKGELAIKLVNRGVDWQSANKYAHLAAAQIRLRCSASN